MQDNEDKIIFTGPVGAGKTTAIASISDKPPVCTDVNCRGDEKKIKKSTTVAMDYSYIDLEDGSRVHLYGTPGQERFSFMWGILTQGGIGLVILINNDHDDPLSQMEYYLDAFKEFISKTSVVIGVTRVGLNDEVSIEQYQERLYERGQVYPIFEVDGREAPDVKVLVQALITTLSS